MMSEVASRACPPRRVLDALTQPRTSCLTCRYLQEMLGEDLLKYLPPMLRAGIEGERMNGCELQVLMDTQSQSPAALPTRPNLLCWLPPCTCTTGHVENTLSHRLPPMLEFSLSTRLLPTLTYSITHALVPVLAKALSYNDGAFAITNMRFLSGPPDLLCARCLLARHSRSCDDVEYTVCAHANRSSHSVPNVLLYEGQL